MGNDIRAQYISIYCIYSLISFSLIHLHIFTRIRKSIAIWGRCWHNFLGVWKILKDRCGVIYCGGFLFESVASPGISCSNKTGFANWGAHAVFEWRVLLAEGPWVQVHRCVSSPECLGLLISSSNYNQSWSCHQAFSLSSHQNFLALSCDPPWQCFGTFLAQRGAWSAWSIHCGFSVYLEPKDEKEMVFMVVKDWPWSWPLADPDNLEPWEPWPGTRGQASSSSGWDSTRLLHGEDKNVIGNGSALATWNLRAVSSRIFLGICQSNS